MSKHQIAEASVQYQVETATDEAVAVMPPGYKQTEAGVIPDDWGVTNLGSLVAGLEAGVSVNSIDRLEAFHHGQHILKTSCVSGGYFYPEEAKSILPVDIHRAKTSPRKGCIIVSRMNTPDLVGELGYVPVDVTNAYLPDRLWQMKFYKEAKLNTRWLAYILSFPQFAKKIKEAATGTSNSMKNISKGSLLSLEIPLPEEKEQTAIANALSDVDVLINGLEKAIAKKQAIKTATMQQLLTGRTRLPQFTHHPDGTKKGYKTTELGEVPEDWEVVEVGKIGGFGRGRVISHNEINKAIANLYPVYSSQTSNNGVWGILIVMTLMVSLLRGQQMESMQVRCFIVMVNSIARMFAV